MRFSDGVDRAYLGRESKFMKMYLSDMYLRPSCYKCHFKGIERESDITLGDFWGVNNWKELDKSELKKGISIVMVHSEKGERLLNACDKQLYFWESSVSVFDKENVYIKNSAEKSYDIKFFKYCFKRMKCEDIIQIYEKTKMIRELTKKIKRKVNNVLARGFK